MYIIIFYKKNLSISSICVYVCVYVPCRTRKHPPFLLTDFSKDASTKSITLSLLVWQAAVSYKKTVGATCYTDGIVLG